MKNIKITVEYDGTNYYGWQRQPNVPTIQGEIEKALFRLTGVETPVTGCSRTDRGVHALNHVSNFLTVSPIPPEKFFMALNTELPADIVVKSSSQVPRKFHARHSAIGKRYIYKIHNAPVASALLRHRAWSVYEPLDTEAMKEAAGFFIGTFDYSAFQAVGSPAETTIRTIREATITTTGDYNKGDLIITFDVMGESFLYNMVRIMAGTLVYVGMGKIKPHEIRDIIDSRDRKMAGITAPPQGLYLAEVYYE